MKTSVAPKRIFEPHQRISESTYSKTAQIIYDLLQYTELNDVSLTEVMGYTAHAFRITVHPEKVRTSELMKHSSYELVAIGLYTFGFQGISFMKSTKPRDINVRIALLHIQNGIEKGYPGIQLVDDSSKYRIVYGYDNSKNQFYVIDGEERSTVSYEDFCYAYFCQKNDLIKRSPAEMLKDTLRRILVHAYGKSFYAFDEYEYGLKAYDAWIKAFDGSDIDVYGNAYNAALVADARKFAYLFFSELENTWPTERRLAHIMIELFGKCKNIYQEIAEIFTQFQELFPLPHGGDPYLPETKQQAILLLKKAAALERRGIELIETLSKKVKGYKTEWHCRLVHKNFQLIGEQHQGFYEDNDKAQTKALFESIREKQEQIITKLRVETLAYFPKREGDQQLKRYIVGYNVLSEMETLPDGLVYVPLNQNYAHIYGSPMSRKKLYDRLNEWMEDQGLEEDDSSPYVETELNDGDKCAMRLDIYIPVK